MMTSFKHLGEQFLLHHDVMAQEQMRFDVLDILYLIWALISYILINTLSYAHAISLLMHYNTCDFSEESCRNGLMLDVVKIKL